MRFLVAVVVDAAAAAAAIFELELLETSIGVMRRAFAFGCSVVSGCFSALFFRGDTFLAPFPASLLTTAAPPVVTDAINVGLIRFFAGAAPVDVVEINVGLIRFFAAGLTLSAAAAAAAGAAAPPPMLSVVAIATLDSADAASEAVGD